jgi:hypothetical protein
MNTPQDEENKEIKDEDGETLPVDEWPELEEDEEEDVYDEEEYV